MPMHQEQVFLFLEMLKVFFPGGDVLHAPNSLKQFESSTQTSPDEISIRLISRIFSLFSIEDVGINTRPITLKTKLDFDISQFCTLLNQFKSTWMTTMKVILFRSFQAGKSSILNQ